MNELLQLTIIINYRIEQLEKDKERLFKSVGELMVENEKAYDDLPSTIIIALDDAKQNIKNIELEITTLSWVLGRMKG